MLSYTYFLDLLSVNFTMKTINDKSANVPASQYDILKLHLTCVWQPKHWISVCLVLVIYKIRRISRCTTAVYNVYCVFWWFAKHRAFSCIVHCFTFSNCWLYFTLTACGFPRLTVTHFIYMLSCYVLLLYITLPIVLICMNGEVHIIPWKDCGENTLN